ncbi:MAG: PAS domain S-box protein [Cytophagales bacterium]|nr:MAG: PAS domain S-box protein [Cytophagales bacterium]
MFNEIKIGSKITSLLLAVVISSVFAISFLSYRLSKDSIEERYWESMQVMSSLKASQLESIFQQLEYNLSLIQESGRVIESIELANKTTSADSAYLSIARRLDNYLYPIQEIYQYKNILLVDGEGRVIYRTNKEQTDLLEGELLEEYDQIRTNASKGIYYGNLNLYKNQDKRAYMNVAAPIYTNENQLIGYVVTEFNMDKIYEIASDSTGLKRTGEIILCKLVDNKIEFLNKPRNSSYSLLTYSVLVDDENSESLQKAVKKVAGYGFTKDYRDKVTLSNWKYLPTVGWGLVVKIDKEEINKDLNYLVIAFILSGCLIIIVSFTVSYIFSKILIKPLISLRNTLNVVSKGILPETVNRESNDEIGEMAIATLGLVNALKRTANFAHRIGEGNYDADFKPMSEVDTLGTALINMCDSIQTAEKKDNERNWIISGVAEIGQILRSHNNIDELGDAVVAYITEAIKAIQGGFYVVDESQEGVPMIEMRASYAYKKKKYIKSKFRFAEGLVGQAAIEQGTILRIEIPDDYVTITSGLLGDKKPKCLLIVPLIIDDIVHGVLEFAGFERFNTVQIKFVEEISVSIARTISNIKVNERTVMLLQESQQMSEELQLQQEVLRQNAEEMEATQEELRRTNTRLEDQILEVKRTQKTMQVLLENASEVITIYESNGKARYISPSVEPILGYSSEEMIGVNDIIHVHPNSVEVYQNMFDQLLEFPENQVTVQYEYRKKNGETIWLEATGNNLLSDPAIGGIVINSRDITERRRAERESRMRGQMQSLSENSPDLITRINTEGTVYYINPVIKNLTGLLPEVFLGKTIDDTDLNSAIVVNWTSIIKQIVESKTKSKIEMDFPSIYGNRTMQVNAIPEYNEKKELESVLIVSNDITERKEAELEILNINKKITESINYAKRIQSAIIPDTKILQGALNDAFVYYRPRDVVSGDFPWFVQRDNNVYVAVVDCTGHGVPGALISLIGYFILNDITNKYDDCSTGEMLNLLDQGVTKTLRQEDSESSTRDGMDIALCKINLDTCELEYSGAHRPLYFVQNEEITEIKGDRFPIGGGQHKKRTNFTTTKIKFKPSDQVYMFSDGLPDQFGGASDNLMKYSPRKLRDLILDNQGVNMSEMHQIVDDSFETWRSNRKQTDDVLLIGIKF